MRVITQAALAASVALCLAGCYWEKSSQEKSNFTTITGKACSIAVVRIAGDMVIMGGGGQASTDDDDAEGESLTTSYEHVRSELDWAQEDPAIKGIVLWIDSEGGYGGDLIADRLKQVGKPSVAFVLGDAKSSAYEAAIGADRVIAAPFADVGSIGVTASFVEHSKEDVQNGRTFVRLSTGRFKDMGSPHNQLTADERDFWEKQLEQDHERFVKEVADARHLPVEQVASIAHGGSFSVKDALKHRLIDEVGYESAVTSWFMKEKGISPATLCAPE